MTRPGSLVWCRRTNLTVRTCCTVCWKSLCWSRTRCSRMQNWLCRLAAYEKSSRGWSARPHDAFRLLTSSLQRAWYLMLAAQGSSKQRLWHIARTISGRSSSLSASRSCACSGTSPASAPSTRRRWLLRSPVAPRPSRFWPKKSHAAAGTSWCVCCKERRPMRLHGRWWTWTWCRLQHLANPARWQPQQQTCLSGSTSPRRAWVRHLFRSGC
mmetsp:Transcript_55873/g.130924  ORF Transcript_55873/g.130924 Transcript_55873/m.130924 type:complete len:212 (-) Transcript_55873:2745-3380(-)